MKRWGLVVALATCGTDASDRWDRAVAAALIVPPLEVGVRWVGPDGEPQGDLATAPVGPWTDPSPHAGWIVGCPRGAACPSVVDVATVLRHGAPTALYLAAPDGIRVLLVTPAADGTVGRALYAGPAGATLQRQGPGEAPFSPVTGPPVTDPPASCPDQRGPAADVWAVTGDPTEDWRAFWHEGTEAPCAECTRVLAFEYPAEGPWRMGRLELGPDHPPHVTLRTASEAAPPLAIGRLLGLAPPAVTTVERAVTGDDAARVLALLSEARAEPAPPACVVIGGSRWMVELSRPGEAPVVWVGDAVDVRHPARYGALAVLLL